MPLFFEQLLQVLLELGVIDRTEIFGLSLWVVPISVLFQLVGREELSPKNVVESHVVSVLLAVLPPRLLNERVDGHAAIVTGELWRSPRPERQDKFHLIT